MERRKFLSRSGTAIGGGLLGTYGLTSEASAQEPPTDGQTQAPAQFQQLEGEWPKYRYDLPNTGHAPTETGPEPPVSVRWMFETGRGSSSPAVVDGTVYIGSVDGNVYALDETDGSEQWRFGTDGSVNSSPAVANGTVYVGSDDGTIYALDATSGSEQWQFETDGPVRPSPAVANGTVYVGSYDTNVYALDAGNGSEQWIFETGGWITSSPAVADGIVYVGSRDDNVYAIDTTSGDEQWRFETLGGVGFSSPAVVDGTVYIGGWDYMYAIDATTGAEQWRFGGIFYHWYTPAVADGTVYVEIQYLEAPWSVAVLQALDASDGTPQWSTYVEDDWMEAYLYPPVVVDESVYVGASEWSGGGLYALNADGGALQWNFDMGSYVGPPVVVDATVYGGSGRGAYAIESEPAEPAAAITFSEQESDGSVVVVDEVELSHGGYVEITDADGTVRGQSAILEAGTHENVEVTLSPVLEESQNLTATGYLPSGEPYLEDDEPVSDTALITVTEPVEPTASITFDDQKSDGTSVTIRQVELSEGGFVEITDEGGVARGRTAPLDAGTHENLEVMLTPPLTERRHLTATVYRDIDAPYLDDGQPVSATALVLVHTDEEPRKTKRSKRKRTLERKKREYEKARKKYEKGRLRENELKKKRGAYERAKRECEEYKKRGE
ncbi:PQQ-binding-like beta-propeller repeat protein [Natrialba sp. INN-245]|uniref:outer membrane protein assembly factor BamB family protein n=1 Tax=Natrialba sp. INN-245 TaxID=2690967 RepID=UPI00130FC5DA|nr:PQQ-binding-like beta-propeller repeat protein [Natrialba sp. INN-245]MWV39628.1 PQQ-binding-like beta-propeller repeat protein [Natrialba sp. INN-245]